MVLPLVLTVFVLTNLHIFWSNFRLQVAGFLTSQNGQTREKQTNEGDRSRTHTVGCSDALSSGINWNLTAVLCMKSTWFQSVKRKQREKNPKLKSFLKDILKTEIFAHSIAIFVDFDAVIQNYSLHWRKEGLFQYLCWNSSFDLRRFIHCFGNQAFIQSRSQFILCLTTRDL